MNDGDGVVPELCGVREHCDVYPAPPRAGHVERGARPVALGQAGVRAARPIRGAGWLLDAVVRAEVLHEPAAETGMRRRIRVAAEAVEIDRVGLRRVDADFEADAVSPGHARRRCVSLDMARG